MFFLFIIFAAVLEASREVQRSQRLRILLEVVLAFGNYMNRGARGNASGENLAIRYKKNDIYRIARTKSGGSVSVRIPIQAKGQTKETS